MCMVSMVTDYTRENVAMEAWDWEKYYKLVDILKRLDELDKALDEPECVDERKEEYVSSIKAYLTEKQAIAQADHEFKI